MLTQINISGLFNKFNYEIKLKQEGITILTGPNGYGKTTILKIIDAYASKKLGFFFLLPFTEITLIQEESQIRILKKDDLLEIQTGNETPILFTKEEIIPEDIGPLLEDSPFKRFGENIWLDRSTGIRYSKDKLINKLIEDESIDFFKNSKKQVPDFGDVYLIKEQRLIREDYTSRRNPFFYEMDMRVGFRNVIEKYAEELSLTFKDILAKASMIGQKLDRSFPGRLFGETREISEDDYNVRYNKIKEKQKRLSLYSLSSGEEEQHTSFKKENAKALLVYLDDTEQKLAIFDEILPKLDVFSSIINEQQFAYKHLEISPNFGFRFLTDNNKELTLTDLSSGEQQEVVILYELLFRSNPNTLVLIDEPELSLHVAWQKKVLDNLLKIIKLKMITIIVATHSPQIIGNHEEDLTIDLFDIAEVVKK